jgi:hypothetical protein
MELQRTIVRDHIRTLQAEAAAERLLHRRSTDDEEAATPAIGRRLTALARPATVAAATTGSRVRPVGRHDGRDDDPCLGASSPC